MIEESIDSEITQDESDDAIVESIKEIPNEESNHIEQSYIEPIQNLDIFCGDLVSYEDILSGDDSFYTLVPIDFEATPKF